MQYMYKSLYSKFAQNETIYRQLMHTGNKFLVYATDEDRTWGIGVDRTGCVANSMYSKTLVLVCISLF